VTARSDFRTWVNDRGSGKLCSVDLLDPSGGEIRATMFNDDADRLHPLLQVGRVFRISKGQVKFANKKFNKLPHDYEITLNAGSEVEEVPDDGGIARMRWSFVSLAGLEGVEPDSIVDVVGVVTVVADPSDIVTKKGDTITKRDVTLVDNSDGARSVRVTLWRDLATTVALQVGDVVACKAMRVGDFQGKSLSSVNASQVIPSPAEVPEAVALKAWYDSVGGQVAATPVGGGGGGGGGSYGPTPFKTFAQVHDEHLGAGDSTAFFMTRASLSMLNATGMNWYPACPADGCSKKVVQDGSGSWQCEKCQRQFDEPNYRYILNIGADDHTGMQYLTAFNDVGEKIMGATARELNELKDNDPVANEARFAQVLMRKFNFKIKAKTEMYQQEPKLRCVILEADPVDYVSDTARLIDEIKAM
jgi:replication factor A1